MFAFTGALVSALLQDYIGRKKLAIASIRLLGISYVLLGFSLFLSAYELELMLSLAMFFSFMNVSVAYAIQTEVFPTELKSFADGITFSINRVANFAFGSLVPVLLALGVLTHFMWVSGALVIFLAFILALLGIETKNKSLEIIETELVG